MTDLLLTNANIYTLDDAHTRGTVIAIRDGKIEAIGGEDICNLATARTQIQDMQGAMVVPGLVDAHIHWAWTSQGLRQVDLFDVPSKEASVRRVATAAERSKTGEWVLGRGWAQSMWPGGEFPTAADLDAVAPHNPVLLRARSGHAVWVNSAALHLAGITDSTPDPADGAIMRDETGRATGILLEGAEVLVAKHIPKPTAEALAEMMAEAQPLAWRAGLTGIHDFDGPQAFAAMQVLREREQLGLRVVKNINDPYIAHAHALGLRWGLGDEWLRLGGLKIFADGALGPRTALMIEPYEGEPDNRGITVTDKETMYELVSIASKLGFPATIHAIGDKAVHDVLDVYEAVRAEEAALGIPRHARRHRIEHVQVIHPSDAGRLAALDLIASMQPIHATADYLMADKHWGEARNQWAYNARYQIDHGVRVAFGSDSPVEPFEPIKGIHAAVTRRRADGSPGPDGWFPALRLTVDEALRGYTAGPAYTGGMERRLGKIAPGYLADLTCFDRDLYQIAPDDLLKAQVAGTMINGAWMHRV
jgi:hypothetical protein